MGILAGMRTSAAPVIANRILSSHPSKKMAKGRLGFMQSKTISKFFLLSAMGEFIVDKLPGTPDRIKPGGVAFRSAAGGLAGAALYEATGENPFVGAAVGAAAACAATYGSFYLRKSIVKKTGVRDPLIGSIEDLVVAGAFAWLAWKDAKRS